METYKFENRQAYIKALDSVLPTDYLCTRDLSGGKKHTYLPNSIKEAVADDFFYFWNVVNEKYTNIANELVCTVELIYMPSYPDAIEQRCTGSAAVPIQMKAGSSVVDFPSNKLINSLEYNVPAVRNEAIANALESLGNIFGRNLNRKIGDSILPSDFSIRKYEK